MVKVLVPATSANLGPGFDAVGLALQWFDEIEIKPVRKERGSPEIRLEGKGTEGVSTDGTNLVYRAVRAVFSQLGQEVPPLSLTIKMNIPVARGLGSSAAAIVGGLLAGNALAEFPFSSEELFQLACRLEDHPDNVAPALFGGLTISYFSGERFRCLKLEPPQGLSVVLAIPHYASSTAHSRRWLPRQVSLEDASFNVGRAALLVGSLLSGRFEHLDAATRDRLHQPTRLALFAGVPEAMEAARRVGALGTALSGGGPSVLAFAKNDKSGVVAEAMRGAFSGAGVACQVVSCRIEKQGARVVGARSGAGTPGAVGEDESDQEPPFCDCPLPYRGKIPG